MKYDVYFTTTQTQKFTLDAKDENDAKDKTQRELEDGALVWCPEVSSEIYIDDVCESKS